MRSGPMDQRGGTRLVWGTMASTGAMNAPGSGDWVSVKLATGQYQIRFPRYKTIPLAAVSSAGSVIIGSSAIDNGVINFYTYSYAGAAVDAAVNFQIVGRD